MLNGLAFYSSFTKIVYEFVTRMNKKRSNNREMIDFIELNKDMTKFRREDQYLKK